MSVSLAILDCLRGPRDSRGEATRRLLAGVSNATSGLIALQSAVVWPDGSLVVPADFFRPVHDLSESYKDGTLVRSRAPRVQALGLLLTREPQAVFIILLCVSLICHVGLIITRNDQFIKVCGHTHPPPPLSRA